jgi:F-type H+-transporting ATPase subunit gamma
MTSDRGLCGGFNSSIVRGALKIIRRLLEDGKEVKVLCVGRKGRDILRRDFRSLILDTFEDIGRKHLSFADATMVGDRVLGMFASGEFDVCTIIYNRFQSAMTQIVTPQQLIPFQASRRTHANGADGIETSEVEQAEAQKAVYEFEPDEQEILEDLLPRNLSIQLFRALLENAASEQGARMTAMDNATRNAGEMIDDLTVTYNRTRQAFITKELIEIISGAEAL